MPALPITLTFAGALALINLWLTWRVGEVRRREQVDLGDGGSDRVLRRMRAHANFAENAPLTLALAGLIEFTAGTTPWLWLAAAAFLIARLAHSIGMDAGRPGRMAGTWLSATVQLALAIWAIALPLAAHRAAGAEMPVEAVGRG